MMKNAFFIALGLLVLASCTRKSLSDPIVLEPELSVRFQLDGMDAQIAAGEDGFYLQPSFRQTEGGVGEFVATFQKSDDNPTSLEVIIRDDASQLPNAEVNIDDAVSDEVLYVFQDDVVTLDNTQLDFCSYAGTAGLNYDWTINGESYDSDQILGYDLGGVQQALSAKLVISDGFGCSDSLVRAYEVFDQSESHHDYFYQPFGWERTGNGNQIRMWYDGDEEDVTNITWNIKDGALNVVEEGPIVWYTFQNSGSNSVAMTVEVENGFEYIYKENVSPDPEQCLASIRFQSPVLGDAQASAVRVVYTNEEGTRYSSFVPGTAVNPENEFFITASEVYTYTDFDTLEEREGRRVTVQFSCTLYNVDNPSDQLQLTDFEGTIAVSTPD